MLYGTPLHSPEPASAAARTGTVTAAATPAQPVARQGQGASSSHEISRLHSLHTSIDAASDGSPLRHGPRDGSGIDFSMLFEGVHATTGDQDIGLHLPRPDSKTKFAGSDVTQQRKQDYRAHWHAYQVERRTGCAKHLWNAAAGWVNYLPFFAGSVTLAASGSAVLSTGAIVLAWTALPPLAERLRDTVWTNPADELLGKAREINTRRVREFCRSRCAGTAARNVDADLLATLTRRQNLVLEHIGFLYLNKMCTDDLTCLPYGFLTATRLLLLKHFPDVLVLPGSRGVAVDLAEKFVAGSLSGALFMNFAQLARCLMAHRYDAHGLDHLAGTQTVNRSRALWAEKKAYLESLLQDIDQELSATKAALVLARSAERQAMRQRRQMLKVERQRIVAKLDLASAYASHFGFWAHDIKRLFSTERLLTTFTAMLGKALCLVPQTLLASYPIDQKDTVDTFGKIVNGVLPGLFQVLPDGFWARNECIHLVGLVIAACVGTAEGLVERGRAARETPTDIELGTPIKLPVKETRVRWEDDDVYPVQASPSALRKSAPQPQAHELLTAMHADALLSMETVAASDSTASAPRHAVIQGHAPAIAQDARDEPAIEKRANRHHGASDAGSDVETGQLSNSRKSRSARSHASTPSSVGGVAPGAIRKRTPRKAEREILATPSPRIPQQDNPRHLKPADLAVDAAAQVKRRLSFGEKQAATTMD